MIVFVQCPHCRGCCRISDPRGGAARCGACGQVFDLAPALSAEPCRLDVGGATSRGLVRPRNEDCFLLQHLAWSARDESREAVLAVVADGMGGHEGGDVAARLVAQVAGGSLAGVLVAGACGAPADTTLAWLQEQVVAAVQAANRAVHQQGKADPALKGMGATAAVVLVWEGQALIGHVGDCRVYHHRAGQLAQVTRDQTLVARMVELGTLTAQEALVHPSRNEVTQAVGRRPDVDPAAYRVPLAAGDCLVVACDGLHAHVDGHQLADAIRKGGPAASLASRLVQLANQGGGTDNCTVVAIHCY